MGVQNYKRTALLVASGMDILLGSLALLAWLGILPVDLSAWGISRWVAGVVGAVLALSGFWVFMNALSMPE